MALNNKEKAIAIKLIAALKKANISTVEKLKCLKAARIKLLRLKLHSPQMMN